jgi:hypothetical protein
MRNLALAVGLAIAGIAATAQSSTAMPTGPHALVASGLVQDVAYGCGRGWHPNPWGRCVPYGGYGYGYSYGWHRPAYYGYGGDYYRHDNGWHNGWGHHRWGGDGGDGGDWHRGGDESDN